MTLPTTACPVRHVRVVVPARDEEDTIDACLRSLAAARTRLTGARPDVDVAVHVVLDACTDRTAVVAAAHPGVRVHTVEHCNVGASRATGVARATRAGARRLPGRSTWVATTDADSTVPVDWLAVHVDLADRGADLVLGTVEPAVADLAPERRLAWLSRHRLEDGHPHVHGANLGVRLAAYRAVGGFAPLAVDEDVDMVARLRAAGVPVARTGRGRVLTSGRTTGRAPGGFAAYLAGLDGPDGPDGLEGLGHGPGAEEVARAAG